MPVKITMRPPEFDAIQYDGSNDAAVAAFVGFLFQPARDGNPPAVYDPIGKYLRPLHEGSWVVMVDLTLSVLDDAEFHATYLISGPSKGATT